MRAPDGGGDVRRAPNILLIPGTASPEHLRDNLAAAELTLPQDVFGTLTTLAASEEAL